MEKEKKSQKKPKSSVVTPDKPAAFSVEGVEAVQKKQKGFVKVLKFAVLVGLFVGLGYLGNKYKNLVVLGKVGNKYIYRWEVDERIRQRYTESTLEEVITERAIQSELAALNIKVEEKDIQDRVSEISSGLEGTTLEDALAQQGMSMSDFRNRVKLQLGLEKAVTSKIQISDSEIEEFIASNGNYMTSTDDAGKKEEARKAIMGQKLDQEIGTFVSDARAKVTVTQY